LRGDADLDGDVDNSDKVTIQAAFLGSNLGRGRPTTQTVSNREAFSGHSYEHSSALHLHARARVLDTGLGRWTRRDPSEYLQTPNLFSFCGELPIVRVDANGNHWDDVWGWLGDIPWMGGNIPDWLPFPGHGPLTPEEYALILPLSANQLSCLLVALVGARRAGAIAKQQVPAPGGGGGESNYSNYMRHCTMTCGMTKCVSAEFADAFGHAHEAPPHGDSSAIDDEGNHAGIDCGLNDAGASCQHCCHDKFKQSEYGQDW
jgi:RHS repeat-associated protein